MKKEDFLFVYGELGADAYDRFDAEISTEEKCKAVVAALQRRGKIPVIGGSVGRDGVDGGDGGVPLLPMLPLTPPDAHKCPHCPSSFKWPSHLQKHLKHVHGLEAVEVSQASDQEQPVLPEQSFESWVGSLVGLLHEHAQAACKHKPDDVVSRAGRFYTADVLKLCGEHNCCPNYGLYCFGFVRHYSRELVKSIRVTTKEAALVLDTRFVNSGPSYYLRILTGLSAEFEQHEFPWNEKSIPINFLAVMRFLELLPRRAYSSTEPTTAESAGAASELETPPPMAKQSKVNFQKQKAAVIRRMGSGPGPASGADEKIA